MRRPASSSRSKCARRARSPIPLENSHAKSETNMNELSQQPGRHGSVAPNIDEDALLQSALQDSGGLLTNSLREDDRRRRVRRLVVVSLFGGVLVMGTIVIAALAGWLTMYSPPPAESGGAKATAAKAPLSEDARIDRAEALT